ncbi:hypothetical protein ACHAXR_007085 [Thalassiosira sp. AJA248-18]
MFVSGLPFLVTLSRGIRFGTTQYRPCRTAKLLCNALKETIKLYKRAGFIVQTCLMDNEFEPLKAMLADTVVINTTAKNEHVAEIERFIRTLKGKCRCIFSELREIGIIYLPNAIIKALVTFVMMWNNGIHTKQGVSQELSPREIILRWQLSTKHMKAHFGAYCEVFEDDDITNNQQDRACWGICLGPTGNMQGTYKFFDIDTGFIVKRRTFKVLPTPNRVVKLVNEWGKKNGSNGDLLFTNRNNEKYDWDDEDDVDLIHDNVVELPTAPYPAIPAEMPGVRLESDLLVPTVEDQEPAALSEEAAADAAAANANFGPQDIPIVESQADELDPVRGDTYNFNLGLPHAVPATQHEIDTSSTDHDDVSPEEQEWVGAHDDDVQPTLPTTTPTTDRPTAPTLPTTTPTARPTAPIPYSLLYLPPHRQLDPSNILRLPLPRGKLEPIGGTSSARPEPRKTKQRHKRGKRACTGVPGREELCAKEMFSTFSARKPTPILN